MTSDWLARAVAATATAACLILMAGCGKPSHHLETAPVTGRVTLNGEAVTSGYIYTSPRKGRLATAKIAEDGSFSLGTYSDGDGAIIGEHAVMLAPIPSDEGPTPDGAIVPPERYSKARSSGIVITVPPEGLSDYEIALEGDGKPATPQAVE